MQLLKLTFIFILFSSTYNYSQVFEILDSLDKIPSNKVYKEYRNYADKLEYIYRYSHLDSIKFQYQNNDPSEKEYFEFESSGVYILDLNRDGQMDLIYSGQNGWNGLSDTKYFLHDGEKLVYGGELKGKTLAIISNRDSTIVITNWKPCCDSYTSTLNTYLFKDSTKINLEEVKFFAGQFLSGVPDFEGYKSKTLDNLALFASLIDFHNTAPYFGKYNKSVRKTLFEERGHVRLLIHTKPIEVKILKEKNDMGQKWALVMTQPIVLDNESIFEWPANRPIRYVGWIKSD